MSKRKRNVAFLKPDEPAFITRMKAEAGYKEGPTVDTKREALSFDEDGDDDHDDEEPQVVVLNEGDLTAEEASKALVEKEEGPADLTQRVVFKKPDKAKKDLTESSEASAPDSTQDSKESNDKEVTKTKSKKKLKSKSVLSFTEDDEEDS